MLLIEANLPSGSRWWFPPYFSFGQLAQLLVSLLSVCVHELHWREGCLFVWLFSLNIDRLSPESLTPPLASHCFYYATHLEHFIVISLNTDCKVQCATKGENQHDVKTCVNSTDIKLMVGFFLSFLLLLLSAAASRHSQLCRMCFCCVAVWTSAAVLLWLRCCLAAPPQSLPVWLCTHLQTAVLPVSCQADAIHRECRALNTPDKNHSSTWHPKI